MLDLGLGHTYGTSGELAFHFSVVQQRAANSQIRDVVVLKNSHRRLRARDYPSMPLSSVRGYGNDSGLIYRREAGGLFQERRDVVEGRRPGVAYLNPIAKCGQEDLAPRGRASTRPGNSIANTRPAKA